MGEEGSSTTTKSKESPVLSDASLKVLAREVGAVGLTGLVFAMELNIPTTHIVTIVNAVAEAGFRDVSDACRKEVAEKLMMLWKHQRETAKPRDKVNELKRALRSIGKKDHADVISDRHSNLQELSDDAFANL